MRLTVGILTLTLAGVSVGQAATLTTLYSFTDGSDGAYPGGQSLLIDANGNLIGTTAQGSGSANSGTVFDLASTGSGTFASAPTTLASFAYGTTSPGWGVSGVTLDSSGNIVGMTNVNCGCNAGGGFFEIPKSGSGYGTLTSLASFGTSGAQNGDSNVVIGAGGQIIGGTQYGGANGYGSVVQLAASGSGYGSSATVIMSGSNTLGDQVTGVNVDSAGNVIAAMYSGQIVETPKSGSGFGTPVVLGTLPSGSDRLGAVAFDAGGDIYGLTFQTGPSQGGGILWEIPNTGSGYGTLTDLETFSGASNPGNEGNQLLIDSAGNIWGSSQGGGTSSKGEVWEVQKIGSSYTAPIDIASFTGTNGQWPYGGLTADSSGDLFGTTHIGGANGYGTIFEITGAGFGDAALPEPASLAVFGTGIAALAARRRRRKA